MTDTKEPTLMDAFVDGTGETVLFIWRQPMAAFVDEDGEMAFCAGKACSCISGEKIPVVVGECVYSTDTQKVEGKLQIKDEKNIFYICQFNEHRFFAADSVEAALDMAKAWAVLMLDAGKIQTQEKSLHP